MSAPSHISDNIITKIEVALKTATAERRIDLLNQLHNQIYLAEPRRAESIAQEAVRLSIAHSLPRWQVISYLGLIDCLFSLGNFGKRKAIILKVKQILIDLQDPDLNEFIQCAEAEQYFTTGDIEQALMHLLSVDNHFRGREINTFRLRRTKWRVKIFLGLCWLKLNNPITALDTLSEGFDFAKRLTQHNIIHADFYASTFAQCIGRVHMSLSDFELARAWFCKATKLNKSHRSSVLAIIDGLLIAESYVKEGDWDAAIHHLDKLKPTLDAQQTNPTYALYWHHFYAISMRHLGKYQAAYTHIQQAFFIWNDARTPIIEEELTLELGLIKLARQEIDDGLVCLQDALVIATDGGNKLIAGQIHKEFAAYYKRAGEFDHAFEHLNLEHELGLQEMSHATSMAIKAIEYKRESAQRAKDAEIVQLRNDELAQKNNELESANEQKTRLLEERNELLRMAAHDLRNPLTSIQLDIHLLRVAYDQLAETKRNQKLAKIERTTQNMAKLLDRMLSSDRIEQGDLQVSLAPVDIVLLTKSVIEQVAPPAELKSITLVNQTSRQPYNIISDQIFLQQILVNLLSNAIKYSPADTVVQLTTQTNGGELIFTISDQGLGLTEDDMQHLFKRYQRLSARPTAGEPSVGLGLHITQNLVTALKGRIEADSRGKNQGTTFKVFIPIATTW